MAILKRYCYPTRKTGDDCRLLPNFPSGSRELTVSVMLYGPSTRTIGVAIYTLNEDGETVYSAALAGIALIIIVLGQTVIKRYAEKKTQK